MFGLGIGEIIVVLVIILIFVPTKKLPELAKGLGKGIREFQNAANGLKQTIQNPVQEMKEDIQRPLDQPLDQPEDFAQTSTHTHEDSPEMVKLEDTFERKTDKDTQE